MKRFIVLAQTLRYLTVTQIWYQVYYRVRGRIGEVDVSPKVPLEKVKLKPFASSIHCLEGKRAFLFLNRAHSFDDIDWNFGDFGKLWAYNLNYFDFLNQNGTSKETGLSLIRDFISKKRTHKDGYEPYPTSIRIMNWVKFLSKFEVRDDQIDRQLYSDCTRLTKNLEYHLLANHLLENGFGLLFGAYYFRDERLYQKAVKIVRRELREQVLEDGGHFELSPMYHQIILWRVLDSYNLVCSNNWMDQDDLKDLLHDTAQRMLSWLDQMTFKSGDIPMVNDASPGITLATRELQDYANSLGLDCEKNVPLGASGYRYYENGCFELLCDVGQIAPSYQPGHSHADSLNFILHINGFPCIVDTGVSTYEKNERRQKERSTESHNTLEINNENSSYVWSGFRVGKRARTTILHETGTSVVAQHNGYRSQGVIHQRAFELNNGGVRITDHLKGKYSDKSIRGFIHFHPEVSCKVEGNKWIINEEYALEVTNVESIRLESYQFADGFNRLREARRIVYKVVDNTSSIYISKMEKALHENTISD